MNTPTQKTAALLIIGNEILSGRTKDKNLAFLGEELNKLGIRMLECRVVADIEAVIMDAVTRLSETYDYVFTTGGIGPTHDDITGPSIAKAFGVSWVRHEEAERRLRAHYSEEDINEARLRMANIPEGASLIDNPVSAAPGYKIRNVHVMAGVPRIMQAMFDFIRPTLSGGATMLSRSLLVSQPEGALAEMMREVQAGFEKTEIGSYPYIRDNVLSTNIVIRGLEGAVVDAACEQVMSALEELDIDFVEGEHAKE